MVGVYWCKSYKCTFGVSSFDANITIFAELETLRTKIPSGNAGANGNLGVSANADALLFALANFCPKLRKLKTRLERASNEALDRFLTACVFLEYVDIFPVSNSVLLIKLSSLHHLHVVYPGNIFRADELRSLIFSGFRPKYVSLRQGVFGLRGPVLDKLSCCAQTLTSVTIELSSCNELTRVVDACGAFLKTLVIKGDLGVLKNRRHESGGMARMWSRLQKLEAFGCAHLKGCCIFSRENLRTLEVSFDAQDAANQALLSIGKHLVNLSCLIVKQQPVTMLSEIKEVLWRC